MVDEEDVVDPGSSPASNIFSLFFCFLVEKGEPLPLLFLSGDGGRALSSKLLRLVLGDAPERWWTWLLFLLPQYHIVIKSLY